MLERHHLEIIRAFVHYGTLTKAAESLYLTQSAVSHSIKKIEDALNVPLFEKKGRQLVLTRAGHYLYQLSNMIVPQFERAEEQLKGFADGKRGNLRIGMECHPCYQWLLKTVRPYLEKWADVDVDVHQQFQFKGIAALYAYEIDLLITPDPIFAEHLLFKPVFPFEQVLVIHETHPLAQKAWIEPEDLENEILITYPVPIERLDIFELFLNPAKRSVAAHKTIETTEILLEMIAANRGVSALPSWLIFEKASHLPLICKPLGKKGIHKNIYVGIREQDAAIDYIEGFIEQTAVSV